MEKFLLFVIKQINLFSSKLKMLDANDNEDENRILDPFLQSILEGTKEEINRTYPHLNGSTRPPVALSLYEIKFMEWIISLFAIIIEENFCIFIDSNLNSVLDLITSIFNLLTAFDLRQKLSIGDFHPIYILKEYLSRSSPSFP